MLALIQVLALDPDTARSEDGMTKELQGQPKSAAKWFEVAKEHREFFRVAAHEHGLSLVARYVLPKDGEKRPALPPDFVGALLQTAITIHDRQVSAAEWWKSLMNPIAVLLAAIVGALAALAGSWINHGSCR